MVAVEGRGLVTLLASNTSAISTDASAGTVVRPLTKSSAFRPFSPAEHGNESDLEELLSAVRWTKRLLCYLVRAVLPAGVPAACFPTFFTFHVAPNALPASFTA